jgi:hypothetical protein
MVAGGIDAGVNVVTLGGKAVVETGLKTGIKRLATTGVKEVVELEAKEITSLEKSAFDSVFEMPRNYPGQRMQGMHNDHALPRALDRGNPALEAASNQRPMPAAMNSVDKAPLDNEVAQRFNDLVKDLQRFEGLPREEAKAKAWQAMNEELRAHANSVPARNMDPRRIDRLRRK